MKILKITLENLASYEGSYTIDFTRPPLKEAGLYCITGPTGSGKSTILDAVCLALYGTAPRFEGATELKYFDNKEQHKNERSKILLPGDTRNILRKGAQEGRAAVEFVANDGERYSAVWYVKRGTKNYAPRERTLVHYVRNEDGTETEEILFKRGADSPLFQKIIGLDYEQFTRTIMLAQNSFANFIKCDGKEKARLLERLTGTEIYTKIAMRINVHYKQAQSLLNDFRIKLEAEKRDKLEDEARTACEAELKQANERVASLEDAVKRTERQINWCRQVLEDRKAFQEAESSLKKLLKEWDETADVQQKLADYNQLAQLSGKYETWKQYNRNRDAISRQITDTLTELEACRLQQNGLREQAAGIKAQLQEVQKTFEQMQPHLRDARRIQSVLAVKEETAGKLKLTRDKAGREWEDARKDLEANQSGQEKVKKSLKADEVLLEGLKPFEESLRKADVLLKQLGELQKKQTETRAFESDLIQRQTDLKRISSEVMQLKAQCQTEQKAVEQLEQRIADTEAQLKGRNGIALRKATEEARDRVGLCDKALTAWLDYFGSRRTVYTCRLDIEKRKVALNRLQSGTLQLTKCRFEVEKQLPGIQTAFQMFASENVTHMRSLLKDNEPCPVCGAVHHPYAAGSAAGEAARLLKEKEETLLRKKNELDGKITRQQEAIGKENGLLSQDEKSLEKELALLPEKEKAWKAVAEIDESLSVEISEEDRDGGNRRYQFLKEKLQEAKNWYELCKKAEDSFFKLDTVCKDLQKERDNRLAVLRRKEQTYNEVQVKTIEKQQEITSLTQRIRENKDAIRNMLAELDGYGLEADWRELWNRSPSDYAAKWRQRAETWQKTCQEQEQNEAALKALQAAFEALKKQETTTNVNFKRAAGEYEQCLSEKKELKRQLDAFWDTRSPDEVEQEMQEKIRQCTMRDESIRKENEAAGLAAEKKNGILKEQQKRLKEEEVAGQQLEQEIGNRLETVSCDCSFEQLEWYFSPDRKWEEVRRMLANRKEQIKEMEGQVKIRRQHLSETENDTFRSELTEETLKEQLRQLQNSVEEEKQKQQERIILLNNDKKCRERLQKLAEEGRSLETDFKNWNELNTLMGAHQGDDIRQAAQCYTLQFLVAHANRQLKMLTSRYRLVQVPDSLSLRIKDMDYAGEERNISSLSGGETFLVSLALALGLSAISSANHNYGMLFIDEGFGTLDEEALNTVIDALSTLQTVQGKKVCVISHTQEMRERIPVQIQVVKGNAEGRSSLRIV